MEVVCPACGKRNGGSGECPRCGCELAVLRDIAAAADKALRNAEESLARGDAGGAARQACDSWRLKKSVEAARLAFLAHLAGGEYGPAERWYALTKALSQSNHET